MTTAESPRQSTHGPQDAPVDPAGLRLPDGPLKDAFQELNLLFVLTRRHGSALQAMKRLARASPYTRSHQGFALLGESGAGKTSTTREFESWLRAELGLAATDPSPFPCITLSGSTTTKDLLVDLLRACRDPLPSTGTRAVLEKRFFELAPVSSIYGIAIDEVHHAFEAKSGSERVVMAQTLKNIVSGFPKPLIALGPLKLEQHLDATDGMAMRFEQREFLEDMRLDLVDDLHDMRAVLMAMDRLLPSEPGWSLDSADMLKRLYLGGRASFGRIVSLVRRACFRAAENAGTVRVGPAHYSAAWLAVAPRNQRAAKHDPFRMDIGTVTALAAQLSTKAGSLC